MPEPILRTLAEKVDARVAALLVIDVQNDFCASEGAFGRRKVDLSLMQAMVPRLERFLEAARGVDLLRVWVQATYDDIYLTPPMIEHKERRGTGRLCLQGTWGADFYQIKPTLGPSEIVMSKHRYSAFIHTELEAVLRAKGIKTVVLTGVGTRVCVESTARDAFMLGYYVVLVEDCCASVTIAGHQGTLKTIEDEFGSVATSTEIAAAWRQAAVRRELTAAT